MTKKYHILIVDDHPLIIDSLVCMFDNENDFSVIGTVLVQKFSDNSISSIISLTSGVAMMKNHFKGRHFQKDIILVSVGYYFGFSLSYRDIVGILRDRGISVHHTAIMR